MSLDPTEQRRTLLEGVLSLELLEEATIGDERFLAAHGEAEGAEAIASAIQASRSY